MPPWLITDGRENATQKEDLGLGSTNRPHLRRSTIPLSQLVVQIGRCWQHQSYLYRNLWRREVLVQHYYHQRTEHGLWFFQCPLCRARLHLLISLSEETWAVHWIYRLDRTWLLRKSTE